MIQHFPLEVNHSKVLLSHKKKTFLPSRSTTNPKKSPKTSLDKEDHTKSNKFTHNIEEAIQQDKMKK